jgi:hypothetical protein
MNRSDTGNVCAPLQALISRAKEALGGLEAQWVRVRVGDLAPLDGCAGYHVVVFPVDRTNGKSRMPLAEAWTGRVWKTHVAEVEQTLQRACAAGTEVDALVRPEINPIAGLVLSIAAVRS